MHDISYKRCFAQGFSQIIMLLEYRLCIEFNLDAVCLMLFTETCMIH